MKIQIKDRNGKVIFEHTQENNSIRTTLEKAAKGSADLRSADLRYADLSSADLRYAKNLLRLHRTKLKKLRAFKYIKKDNTSPIQTSKIKYEIGKTYSVKTYNKDEFEGCGKGLNVATLEWCLISTLDDFDNYKYIVVEFAPKDIAAIPYSSDGKFRVKKLKVLRYVTKKEIAECMQVMS